MTEAADAADLSPEEQDRVEAALGGVPEGDGPREAAVQLLVMGTSMARVIQVTSFHICVCSESLFASGYCASALCLLAPDERLMPRRQK